MVALKTYIKDIKKYGVLFNVKIPYQLKPTLYSEAHLEVDSACCIGSSAGVSSSVTWLDEGDLQGS